MALQCLELQHSALSYLLMGLQLGFASVHQQLQFDVELGQNRAVMPHPKLTAMTPPLKGSMRLQHDDAQTANPEQTK